MADVKIKKCGNCGHTRDEGFDAMCFCKVLWTRVVKESVACPKWTDTKVF